MVEVMASAQNIGFRSGTRRSLLTQQNPGLNSVKAVSQQADERDGSPQIYTHLGFSDYITATSSTQPLADERVLRMKTAGMASRGISPSGRDHRAL